LIATTKEIKTDWNDGRQKMFLLLFFFFREFPCHPEEKPMPTDGKE
jgi:hypothetical protein